MWYGCGVLTDAWAPDDFLKGLVIEFGGGVRLERIPDWVKSDDALLREGWSIQEKVKRSQFVFAIDYEAESLGAEDPDWMGSKKIAIQDTADQKIVLAGAAVWLVRPSLWTPGHLFHFGRKGEPLSRRRTGICNKVRVAPSEGQAVPSEAELRRAAEIHKAILKLARDGTVWTSLRMLLMGLFDQVWEPRYVALWVVLEALFGPEDPRETTYQLSQRIAQFLGKGPEDRRSIFRRVKDAYRMRSKVVHGARLSKLTEEKSHDLMVEVEAFIRKALLKILLDPKLTGQFDGTGREDYLDELIFD